MTLKELGIGESARIKTVGGDGGEHGSGGKQGLAHLPGLPLAGNRQIGRASCRERV